jgi:MoxR-like ATPase
VVRGEPGIGKTRFVEELQTIAGDLGFIVTSDGRSISVRSAGMGL